MPRSRPPSASARSAANASTASLLPFSWSRWDRALRIVLVRGGCAEEREHAVAGEVFDRAAVVLDRVDDPGHRLADDQLHLLGIELLGKGGRADKVGEECGDDLPLLAHDR